MNTTRNDRFLAGYISCALWSSMDDDDVPLDTNYGREDLSPATLKGMEEDCAAFQKANLVDLGTAYLGAYAPERAGHDFWLTRNRHGSGFWDRNLGDLGDRLTDAAHAYSEYTLNVGDDGKVCA